jgi:hypothetical protein
MKQIRVLLHTDHAAHAGCCKVIRTVDIDVVVIAVACCQQLALAEFWICFGAGRNVRADPVPAHLVHAQHHPAHPDPARAFERTKRCDIQIYSHGVDMT